MNTKKKQIQFALHAVITLLSFSIFTDNTFSEYHIPSPSLIYSKEVLMLQKNILFSGLGNGNQDSTCYLCAKKGTRNNEHDQQINNRSPSESNGTSLEYSASGDGGDDNDPDKNKDVRLLKEDKEKSMVLLQSLEGVTSSYLPVRINGCIRQALVDTGAQITIISKKLIQECGLLEICDTRVYGMAKGIGSATVFGRIHCLILEIYSYNRYLSIVTGATIIDYEYDDDDDYYDLIIGLDFLKKFYAEIDYKNDIITLFLDNNHKMYNPHIASKKYSIPLILEEDLDRAEACKLDQSRNYFSCKECRHKVKLESQKMSEIHKRQISNTDLNQYLKDSTSYRSITLGEFFYRVRNFKQTMDEAIKLFIDMKGDVEGYLQELEQ